MDFKLRNDPKIQLLEKTNARYLTRDNIGKHTNEDIHFIAMDVSFISATQVLPAVSFGVSNISLRANSESDVRDRCPGETAHLEVGRELVGKVELSATSKPAIGREEGGSSAAGTVAQNIWMDRRPSWAEKAIANFCLSSSFSTAE